MKKFFLSALLISSIFVSDSKCKISLRSVMVTTYVCLHCTTAFLDLLNFKNIVQYKALSSADLQKDKENLKKIFLDHKDETINGSSIYDELVKNIDDEKKIEELTNYLIKKLKRKGRFSKDLSKGIKNLLFVYLFMEVICLIRQAALQYRINKNQFRINSSYFENIKHYDKFNENQAKINELVYKAIYKMPL